MRTQEIPSQHWAAFCQRFTEINKGTLLTIHLNQRDGRSEEIARDMPLEAMALSTEDPCSDFICMRLSLPGQRKIDHQIIEPIHIRVRQLEEGHKFIQINAENGTTVVTFRSGRFPEATDDLAFEKRQEQAEVKRP